MEEAPTLHAPLLLVESLEEGGGGGGAGGNTTLAISDEAEALDGCDEEDGISKK